MSQDYATILKGVAASENILNPRISLAHEADKGEGYVAKMCFVDITGTNKSLNVAIKAAPDNAKFRDLMCVEAMFKNEVLFYADVAPIFEKLQEQLETPFAPAKCYHTSLDEGNEHLIFENLKSAGYSTWDRSKLMDREHAVLVFKQYARLHALSYVLKQTDGDSFDFIKANVTNVIEIHLSDEAHRDGFRRLMMKMIEKVPETFKNEDLKRTYVEFYENFHHVFKAATEINKDTVLCHGDCWCNNMMFKYEDGKLTDVKLFDFQVIKIGNPMLDLPYFLYICTSRDVYDDVYGLLEIYYEELKEHARSLGVEITLTLEELKDYWKLYAKLGLFIAFVIIKAIVADEDDDIPDIASTTDQGRPVVDAFDYEAKNDDEYYRRLNDIILHCYENGFL